MTKLTKEQVNKKYHTIGEIFRLGLLKNHTGKPYKHKATISRIVSRAKFEVRNTAWGTAKMVSEKEINRLNRHS